MGSGSIGGRRVENGGWESVKLVGIGGGTGPCPEYEYGQGLIA